ncbi:MAG TPA: carboxylating nicotinate-nucleotide diphosphorylase [Prolixibacteraceae bacterium]|nr:carboxylating nicotinate-nucleotide diphosphorylase [Prolixibacteraceae bacterium]
MKKSGLNIESIKSVIDYALKEDIGNGDITTNSLIPLDLRTKATMVAKSTGVIAGLAIAEYVFRTLSADITWKSFVNDGDKVSKGDLLLEISGSYRALLTGERVALNFLQRMSGIATMTANYVDTLKGYKTKILDTRKTVPGLRLLDKYAVMMGGGTNHRIGLYDMVLIKDNHIKIAGGITNAVTQIKKNLPEGIKIEVETTTIEEVHEALATGVDIIMLDNMLNSTMTESVRIIGGHAKVEASGNMTMDRLKEVAATGVDFISIGALTHSVTAFDISMNIES